MRLIPALAVTATLAALTAAPAAAAPYETVIQDDAVFLHTPEDEIRASLAQVRALGIDRVRITAGWSVIAPEPDAATPPEGDLADPAAYPADRWFNLDRAIRLIDEAGLKAMIDIAFWAPRWATKEPAEATTRLRAEIDPDHYARFAEAVARRYAGGYAPPAPDGEAKSSEPPPDRTIFDELFGRPAPPPPPPEEDAPPPAPLPRVDVFTIWNEPNHPGFLMPQWVPGAAGPTPRSPHLYRALVHASYPAIKRGAPGAKVLIGGLASIGGSRPGQAGVPPLRFLREMACVDDRMRPRTDGPCADFRPVPGDGWAHHPYSLRTLPERLPRNPDHLPVAATTRLIVALDQLVRAGRLTEGNEEVYQTEYGYESNPPDPQALWSLEQQAAFLGRAERIGTAHPRVRMWPQFLLRDRPGDPAGPRNRPFGDWQSGLLFADGTPKPAFEAFRVPATAWCVRDRGRDWIAVWGRLRGSRGAARLRVETTDGARGWRARASRARPLARSARASSVGEAQAGRALVRYVPHGPGRRVRMVWTDPQGTQATGAVLEPLGCRARTAKRGGARTSKRGRTPSQRRAGAGRARRSMVSS